MRILNLLIIVSLLSTSSLLAAEEEKEPELNIAQQGVERVNLESKPTTVYRTASESAVDILTTPVDQSSQGA